MRSLESMGRRKLRRRNPLSILIFVILCVFSAPKQFLSSAQNLLESDFKRSDLLKRVKALAEEDPQAAEELVLQNLGSERPLELLFELGLIKVKRGKLEEARKIFEEICRRNKTFPQAQKNLARILVSLRSCREAVKNFSEAFRREGPDPISCRYLGQALVSLGRYVEAEAAFREALVGGEEDPKLLLDLAKVCFLLEDYASSERFCREALKLDPYNGEGWTLLAQARIKLGREKEALDAVEIAYRLRIPLQPEVFWLRGELLFRIGLYEEASKAFSEASKRSKPSKEKMAEIATAFLSVGRLREAEAYARRLLEVEGDRARGWYILAKVAKKENDPQSAISYLKKALKEDPISGEAMLELANLLGERGDIQEALSWCRAAENIKGLKERALLCRLNLLIKTKRYKEAIALVQELSELSPRPPSWGELLGALKEKVSLMEK